MKNTLKILVLALLVGGVAHSALAQAVILCIGDSITEGVYVSVPYPTRLGRNTGHHVVNAGIGGERAAGGLARINALLTQHNPSHVLILFGTNDILSPSQDLRSSADAVRQIALRVRAHGAIPVVGTAPPMFPPRAFNKPRVTLFPGYGRAHAGANGFRLADIEGAFGSNAGLVISDGFHANDAGMEVIARTFAGRISAPSVPAPGQPTLLAPKGLVAFAPRPTFSWTPGSHAYSHVATIHRNGSFYHSQNVVGSSWTPGFDLPCAALSWSVAGVNGRGTGPGAPFENLYFQNHTCCIPMPPLGLQAEPLGGGQVLYSWTQDACATQYQAWVQRNGATWSTNWHAPIDIGGGRRGAILSGHAIGNYKWWVLGRSPDGTGFWSAAAEFPYGAPIPNSPTGRLAAVPTQLAWNDVTSSTADRYQIWINRNGQTHWSRWIPAAQTFPLDATRRATLRPDDLPLPYGQYSLWMQAGQGSALSPWSPAASFSRGEIAPLAPAGALASATVQLSWDDAATQDATWYQIRIDRGNAPFVQRWVPREETLALSGQQRAYALPESVGYGNFTWSIQAWNPDGAGPWSPPMAFARGQTVPLAPTGNVASASVQLVWDNALAQDASWFRVWVSRNGETFHDRWVPADETLALPGQQRGYDLPVPPGYGNFTWWVQPWVPSGTGPWSPPLSFARGVMVPLAPSGTAPATPRAFTWNDSRTADATWYRIWIERNGATHWHSWIAREDTYVRAGSEIGQPGPLGTYRAFDLPNAVGLPPGSYTWWILPWTPSISGPWSAPLQFILN